MCTAPPAVWSVHCKGFDMNNTQGLVYLLSSLHRNVMEQKVSEKERSQQKYYCSKIQVLKNCTYVQYLSTFTPLLTASGLKSPTE